MARHAPVVEHAGNTVTVIAPTAEEAMALVGDAGPGFRTTSIGKVRRGGLAGFFATEMVRVVAEAPADGSEVALRTQGTRHVAPVGASSPLQLATADDLIASLCGSDGPFAGRLAAGLQRSLHEPVAPARADAIAPAPPTEPLAEHSPPTTDSPAAPPTTPSAPPDVAAPSTVAGTELAATGTAPNIGVGDFWPSRPGPCDLSDGSPERQRTAAAGAWSAAALEAAGLPTSLVSRVAGVRPHDEVTWNAALMLAVRDWCGADLATGAVLAGPACAGLATSLRVPVVATTDVADREGPVALPTASAADLAAAVGERPVHLVVGAAWRHLATVRPATVSAASPDDLIDAVRAAVAWDVPLGWVVQGGTVTRIDPFVVAAHVRVLLAADGASPERPAAPNARRAPAPRAGKSAATAKATTPAAAGRQGASR